MESLLAFTGLVLKLGEVERITEHPDGRREATTTHTVMLALIAASLAPHESGDLSIEKVLRYALVHDLAEAYAGDTPTARKLDKDARKAMLAREAQALAKIRTELRGIPWIAATLSMYELQRDPESRFVHYLDKTMPRFTNVLNGCAPVMKMGMSLTELVERNSSQARQLLQSGPVLPLAGIVFDSAGALCEQAHPHHPGSGSTE